MHFTYEEQLDRVDLRQGDVIRRRPREASGEGNRYAYVPRLGRP